MTSFHILVTREKEIKFLEQIYIYFFAKNYKFILCGFSLIKLLVLILICAILEQLMNNKMLSKI